MSGKDPQLRVPDQELGSPLSRMEIHTNPPDRSRDGRIMRLLRTCLGSALLYGWNLALSAGIVAAQTQQTGIAALPEGVGIRVSAEPDKATVGDPIGIAFDITVPRGYTVEFPALTGQLGEFSILQTYPGPSVPEAAPPQRTSPAKPPAESPAEPRHHRAKILVALYKPGDYTFPPITLTLRDPLGKQVSLSSPGARVHIESVLTNKDENLKDLKRQAEIPEPSRWLLWLGLILMAVIVAVIARWLWHRRRPAIFAPELPRLDPLQLAEVELRDLVGRGLLEKNLVKQFYVILADIVKKVLEAGYGIHAVERTTAEIMKDLRPDLSQGPAGDESRSIESFLVACDLVKFAKSIPSQPENEAAVKAAFEILEYCRKRRAAPDSIRPAQVAEVP